MWIDLVSAGGRMYVIKRKFGSLTSSQQGRTSVYIDDQKVLVDTLCMNGHCTSLLDTNMHVFGSVLLHGKQGSQVAALLDMTSQQLASHHMSILGEFSPITTLLNLGGQVVLGVNQVDPETHVTWLAAQQSEDVYQILILHSALYPLKSTFGVELYKDCCLQSNHLSSKVVHQQPKSR
jgi:hypothetical protein